MADEGSRFGPAPGTTDPVSGRVGVPRAYGEILAVYVVSFGLSVVSALLLLTSSNTQRSTTDPGALASLIALRVMAMGSVVFGVGMFAAWHGTRLRDVFTGRRDETGAAAPAQQDRTRHRFRSRVFSFAVSLAGLYGFGLVVTAIDVLLRLRGGAGQETSGWESLLVAPFSAFDSGLGEELLVTAMVATTLERTRLARHRWVFYLTACALRVPYHLYYGWATPAVIVFTCVNMAVYLRWRRLWPIIVAHTAWDLVQMIEPATGARAMVSLFGVGVLIILAAAVWGLVLLARTPPPARRPSLGGPGTPDIWRREDGPPPAPGQEPAEGERSRGERDTSGPAEDPRHR